MSKKFKQPKPKSTLKAIDKLIEYYKGYDMTAIPRNYGVVHLICPLCAVHTGDIYDAPNCTACPWGNIDNVYCEAARFRSRTTKERLLRLYRWKKKIQGDNPCQLK